MKNGNEPMLSYGLKTNSNVHVLRMTDLNITIIPIIYQKLMEKQKILVYTVHHEKASSYILLNATRTALLSYLLSTFSSPPFNIQKMD